MKKQVMFDVLSNVHLNTKYIIYEKQSCGLAIENLTQVSRVFMVLVKRRLLRHADVNASLLFLGATVKLQILVHM